jgi:hypothetical protein
LGHDLPCAARRAHLQHLRLKNKVATGKFGDLRSLIHAAPTEQSWVALCAEVRRWPAAQFDEELKQYVLHALERWPDALRVMPPDWVGHMLEGRGQSWHITALVRALDVTATCDAELEVWQQTRMAPRVERLCAQDWSSLRSLHIDFPLSPAHWRRLMAAPWFASIRTLTLNVNTWDEALIEAVLLDAPPLHIESLTLQLGRLPESIASGLGLHIWPNLRQLHITRGSTSAAFWRSVATAFPVLDTLALHDTMRWHASFDALAEVEWLPQLQYLDINLYARQNPPEAEEYDNYGGEYGEDYYEELEQLDVDDGRRDHEVTNFEVLLHNPNLQKLKTLRLQDQLARDVADCIAAAPNLSSIEQIFWPTAYHLRYYGYGYGMEYDQPRPALAPGYSCPAAWLDSTTLSQPLKDWLKQNHVLTHVDYDLDPHRW